MNAPRSHQGSAGTRDTRHVQLNTKKPFQGGVGTWAWNSEKQL